MERIQYYLNGQSLNDNGIVVESSTGLIEMPDLKPRKESDWAQMHGKIIDTARPYIKEREIKLNCAWLLKTEASYSGGRNLLLNSTKDAKNVHDTYNIAEFTLSKRLTEGEQYTISANLKVTDDKKAAAFFISGAVMQAGGWVLIPADGRCVVTFTASADMAALNAPYVRVYVSNNAGQQGSTEVTGTASVYSIKMEEGTQATPWTPAPEDLRSVQEAQQYVRENLLALGQQTRLLVQFPNDIMPKPLVYNVIQQKGVVFNWKFAGNDILLKFTIALIEPLPCKLVFKSEPATGTMGATAQFRVADGSTTFDIDWGDGSTDYDVAGTLSSSVYTLTKAHTYTTAGTYYIIVSGDTAKVSNIVTTNNNIELLWTLK